MRIAVTDLCMKPINSIREVLACIDKNGKGIALIIDDNNVLLGTITDGDIRRAILMGRDANSPVGEILRHKAFTQSKPITANLGTGSKALIQLMQLHSIRHIPLVDKDGKVAGLVTLEELLPDQFINCQAVIMAGGFGTRLRPLTEKLPKPMLPMGDRPLMEWIVGQMKETGIGCVNITTHYLPEKIKEHFGDGSNFGIKINYVSEDQPLGTAGALSLIESPNEPLLVINGDILTRLDFRNLFRYHRENDADLTIVVRQHDIHVPYGIIECEGAHVQSIREKPRLSFLINAGIYLLEPTVYEYIPNGAHFDMTELIQKLIDHGRNVISFPIVEYWKDIGQFADYQRAQEDVKAWRIPY